MVRRCAGWILLLGAASLSFGCVSGTDEAVAPREARSDAPPPSALGAMPTYSGHVVGDGGRIDGVVRYEGSEIDTNIAITKDIASCANASSWLTRAAGTLVVSDGKLANVVIWLDGISSGKPLFPGTVSFDNVGCEFVPHVAVGFVGGKVAAHNSDPILHDTSLSFVADGKSLANVALPGAGARVEKNLRRVGIVAVSCGVHEWMQAWLHVFDHPYATVTDAAGSFTLADVPPGSYTLRAWHERLGELSLPVRVEASQPSTLSLTFPK